MKIASQIRSIPTTQPVPAGPRHFHVGATEENRGAYWSLQEAESVVADQARRWITRYGDEAVHVEPGYAAIWRRGVRIDFRSAFACVNPHCAPAANGRPIPMRPAA